MTSDLGFVHVFRPAERPGLPALLLLHGTGGDEHDLVPLADQVMEGAAIISPRGQVIESGMPRFFRRLSEGVFDEADVIRRAGDLAGFVAAARDAYRLADTPIVAVGFSNGANIASAVLLLHPGVLAGAVLLRAMVPLVPPHRPALGGARVLISNGRTDPIVPREQTDQLARMLREARADVDVLWQAAGHQLTRGDLTAAAGWLRQFASAADGSSASNS